MCDSLFQPRCDAGVARAQCAARVAKHKRMTLAAAMRVALEPWQYSDSDNQYAYGVLVDANATRDSLAYLGQWISHVEGY